MLASLKAPFAPESVAEDNQPAQAAHEADGEYHLLLNALGFHPVAMDTVAARTRLTAQVVSAMLLMLELKGEIEAHAGGRLCPPAPRMTDEH